MKAIIIAGGKGERLRPLTNTVAKPMVHVAGKPVLEHIINHFKYHGITDLTICLCYLPDSITSYFQDGRQFGVNIKYFYENPDEPLGTAGAVYRLAPDMEGDFIVAYADILRDLNITDMVKFHEQNKPMATINVYEEYDEIPRSKISFNDQNKITEFLEHPQIKNSPGEFVYTNGSFYILNKNIFDHIASKPPLDFSLDIFPTLLSQSKELLAFPSSGYFIDIGTKEKLARVQKEYKPLY